MTPLHVLSLWLLQLSWAYQPHKSGDAPLELRDTDAIAGSPSASPFVVRRQPTELVDVTPSGHIVVKRLGSPNPGRVAVMENAAVVAREPARAHRPAPEEVFAPPSLGGGAPSPSPVSLLDENDNKKSAVKIIGLSVFLATIAFFVFLVTVGGAFIDAKSASGETAAVVATRRASLVNVDEAFGATRIAHEEIRRSVHAISLKELEERLTTGLQGVTLGRLDGGATAGVGLNESTVAMHRQIFGMNKMTPTPKPSKWWILIKQVFGGLFNIMLWLCVLVELSLIIFMDDDDIITPLVLSAVIVGSSVLQWWTEQQAESMMDSLQRMQTPENVTTYRQSGSGTVELSLPAEELLPGDIVVIEAGQRVPADLRVVDCSDGAQAENSAITGETNAESRRRSTMRSPDEQPIIEAQNVLWSGTVVVQGRLACTVFGIGDDTLIGQIASKIQSARTRSSLEIQIEHFLKVIACVAVIVGVLSFFANLAAPDKREWAEIISNSATAFFAQVPEGLLATVTVCLMFASSRMKKRNVLVRKLDAVETLGCVGILCADKTGTLTSGHMTVTEMVVPEPSGGFQVLPVERARSDKNVRVKRVAECGLLNSTVKVTAAGDVLGTPTEVALSAASRASLGGDADAIKSTYPKVFEIPFNSTNKWMLTVHKVEQAGKVSHRMIIKGAPDRVMDRCKLDDLQTEAAEKVLEQLMEQGKRVLCLAELTVDNLAPDHKFEGTDHEDANFPMDDFEFNGFCALEDPPKEGVHESIARAKVAGVVTIMITGDHPTTAKTIATRIGLLEGPAVSGEGKRFQVVIGRDVEKNMPLDDVFEGSTPSCINFWQMCVQHTRVFARVSPMHKRVIVRAYQHFSKKIVAMTGDGVNDAPALKEAEVGIAMGVRGTEVAKEAADIVLLDDDLKSVVAGMEQGRLCSENLRKSIMYTLCSKLPQVLPTFAVLLGVPPAMNAVQVLLIDIGTDIWTAVAYAWQPAEGNMMQTPPRDPRKDRMINGTVLAYAYAYIGSIQSIVCWSCFFFMPKMWELATSEKNPSQYTGPEKDANHAGITMYYWALVLCQVGAAIGCTTTRTSLFTYGLPNMWLNVTIVVEIIVALGVILVPSIAALVKMTPLTHAEFAIGCSGLFVIVVLEEIRKFLTRRLTDARSAPFRRLSVELDAETPATQHLLATPGTRAGERGEDPSDSTGSEEAPAMGAPLALTAEARARIGWETLDAEAGSQVADEPGRLAPARPPAVSAFTDVGDED